MSCIVEQELKDGLYKAKQKDGNKLTWHIEKAFRNYLRAKRILKK